MAKRIGIKPLLFLAALIGVATSSAQQKGTKPVTKAATTSSLKPGVAMGRIFILTKGGEIKPARLAKVYALYWERTVKGGAERSEAEQNEKTPARAWLEAELNAFTERKQLLADAVRVSDLPPGKFDSLTCTTGLSAYDKALESIFRWALDNPKKADQIVQADSDEEGNFKISAPPGDYFLVVRGRAGFYEAVWEEQSLTVTSGMVTTIKLGSPKQACSDM